MEEGGGGELFVKVYIKLGEKRREGGEEENGGGERRKGGGGGGDRSCVLIPEDLLLRDKRLHEGRELLLYKREMEPGSSLQKEKLNHQRTFLVHNVEDKRNRYLAKA